MLILLRIFFGIGLLVAAVFAVRYLLLGRQKDLTIAMRAVLVMAALAVLTAIGIYIETLFA